MLSVNHFFRARIKGRPLERIMASPAPAGLLHCSDLFLPQFLLGDFPRRKPGRGRARLHGHVPWPLYPRRRRAGSRPDGAHGAGGRDGALAANNYFQGWLPLVMLLLCFVLVWAFPNSGEMLHGRRDGSLPRPAWRPSAGWAAGLAVLAFAALILVSRKATFLYFQF